MTLVCILESSEDRLLGCSPVILLVGAWADIAILVPLVEPLSLARPLTLLLGAPFLTASPSYAFTIWSTLRKFNISVASPSRSFQNTLFLDPPRYIIAQHWYTSSTRTSFRWMPRFALKRRISHPASSVPSTLNVSLGSEHSIRRQSKPGGCWIALM